jgi:membrane-associated phospholipid phosphatase
MIIGAFLTVLLVAFARIYTNQHWFSDVIAGAVIGGASGFLLARWHERHPRTAFDRTLLGASAGQGAA